MVESKDYRSELFMINRAFAWLDIDEAPSSNKGVTMLPPPNTQEMEILQKLYEEKDYESLLWAAESRITTYLFWLDLHFYVAYSLKNLGFLQAHDVVLQQSIYFVKKLPKLPKLMFSDSTPFANKMTKKWLNSQENQTQQKSQKSETKKDLEIEYTIKDIDKLSDMMMGSRNVEDKVLYNIKICKSLVDNNNEILIKSYTKELLNTLDEYKTDKWKTEIALEAYLAVIECLENIGGAEKLLEKLHYKVALLKPSLI